MSKYRLFIVSVAAAAIAVLSSVDASVAQEKKKKVSLQQAWKLCKVELDRAGTPASWQSQRYSMGMACMERYGHKL
jgi:hypothetical protein